ncbi:MAG: hypothetical protein NC218_08255 [Acetobacter sp.]|nr:hypothetical protein [Acetobacter sp.]
MEEFKLPRLDWYDEDGRIYKDALIENFNAIEAAFQELQDLGAIDIQDINWENVHLEDVTLEDEDNKIVNLRSLVKILHLDNLCFNESFTGKKCNIIEYYKDHTKKKIENVTLNLAEGDFIFLSIVNDRLDVVKPANVATKISGESTAILVGQFINGQVQTKGNNYYINYNVLQPLSRMKVTPIPFYDQLNKNSQERPRDRFAGRRLGYTLINKRAGSMINLTMPDVGYKNDGVR